MKQQQFESQHAALWSDVETILAHGAADQGAARLPALYRRLCQSLALCEQRGYAPALDDYLRQLVVACHRRLYSVAAERPNTLRLWLLRELPRRVRAEWRLLTLALLAFWGVALAVGLLVWWQPHWAYAFTSGEQIRSFRDMYQPGRVHLGRGGDAGDVAMFGFYVWHNVSICFRTFAGGLFGGVPALLSLMLNGVQLGVVASCLSQDAATRGTFWPFVVTHSSFEISGLLLSGMAGMRLGLALIHPGRLSRRHALLVASRLSFPLLVGAALLTVLAAFFEGFWSASSAIAPQVKYVVGGLCWLAVLAFFAFAGRDR